MIKKSNDVETKEEDEFIKNIEKTELFRTAINLNNKSCGIGPHPEWASRHPLLRNIRWLD